jgi:pimeloyl-ACP methyl ester carboxylesterase
MRTRNYQITVGPAMELDVGETGPQEGRPVILLHGLSDSWPSYLPLMAEMPKDLRLIAVSLRSHGNSTKPAGAYSLADMAGDVLSLMDALGLGQADIVGHSLGSTVAQKLAEIAPHRVAGLTLIGAFLRMGGNPAVIGLWDEAIAPMSDPVGPGFVRDFQESAVGPDTPRPIIERAVSESMKLRAGDWKSALAAGMSADLTHALVRFSGPTLILHGQLDDFCLAEEQAELSHCPRRRLISHANWGHSPHWERPAEAASAIATFLSEETAAAV